MFMFIVIPNSFGGKHRKNALTFPELYWWNFQLLTFNIIFNIIVLYGQFYVDSVYRKEVFLLQNIVFLLFIDIYNFILVPMKLLSIQIQSSFQKARQKPNRQFYAVSNPRVDIMKMLQIRQQYQSARVRKFCYISSPSLLFPNPLEVFSPNLDNKKKSQITFLGNFSMKPSVELPPVVD